MKLTFWGARGSIASPGPDTVIYGGNTTCVEIELGSGRSVVIDAGTGIRNLGDTLSQRKVTNLHLLLTHIHWDHIMGFPFFAPVFQVNSHIILDGSRKGLEGLQRIFRTNAVDGTWPISFDDLKARIEPTGELLTGKLQLEDALILSHPIQHPQGGMGFKFTENKKTFVFLTDNELLELGWSGSSMKDFSKFCSGADILIHDCQYLPEEMDARRGWGHSDAESVCRLAEASGVGRLYLFHHDPWRKDADVEALIVRCREILQKAHSEIEVDAAAEGMVLEI